MDRSKVERIIASAVNPLMVKLGIAHWKITLVCDLTDDVTLANCAAMPDYEKATIQFNPGLLTDRTAVLKTLRHELFHIVLSPYDLYHYSVLAGLDADSPAASILGQVWTHTIERAVVNLERMHTGLAKGR